MRNFILIQGFIMRAILLAAGIGNRLGAASADLPKCLLEFKHKSLLARHINVLEKNSIRELLIVTGFQQTLVLEAAAKINTAIRLRTVFNPDYRSGSVISLFTAGEFLTGETPVILMDADVLYHPRIMETLISSSHPNCFLLDRDFEPGDEPVKLCVADGKLIDFRKQIDKDTKFDFQGESVGFFRFSPEVARELAGRSQKYIEIGRGNAPYEEVIRDALQDRPDRFGYEDITGIPWIEIDFPEDVIRAKTDILPQIEADTY